MALTARRLRTRLCVLAGITGLVLASLVAVPAAQASTPLQYRKAVSVCPAATSRHLTCFAMRLVPASASALGAHLLSRKSTNAADALPLGPAGGYTPNDIATAYGATPSTKTNVTVGIVDAFGDPNLQADVNVFDKQYGLPIESAMSLRIISETGGAVPSTTDTGWGVEQSLDVEAVRGLCHACKIVMVEASSTGDADLAAAENEAITAGATVVSNSFGGAESSNPPSKAFASAFNHPGIVQVASTGDNGWYDWDLANKNNHASNAPALPAALPTAVAVGGTSLYLNDNGSRASETVWNENGPSDQFGGELGEEEGASGGGCSTLYTAPKWQSSASGYSNTGCAGTRLAADISAIADPFTGYDIYDNFGTDGVGWETLGGTSLAAPVISALWALAGGAGGEATPALSLYGHYKSASSTLYDVTVGGNGFCGTSSATSCGDAYTEVPNMFGAGQLDCYWVGTTATLATADGQCHAKAGYDGPSGVGTPKGTAVFTALKPTAKITAPTTITHGKSASFKGTSSTDPFPGGTITTYSWAWGDGTATSTGSAPTHKYTKAGKYTVKLAVTDSYHRTSSTLSLKVTVK
jgi:subtilase family serine protease